MVLTDEKFSVLYIKKVINGNPRIKYLRLQLAQEFKVLNKFIFIAKYKILTWLMTEIYVFKII